MKRPSFQFYPGDWLSNKKLRRCTHAERGAWIDVMCLLHDPDQVSEYGVIRWPLVDIAQAIGAPAKLLQALRTKGVLKGADVGEQCAGHIYTPRHAGKDGQPVTLLPEQTGPVWYSSRMLEDEHIRRRRATQGWEDAAPKDAPIPPIGEALGGHPSRDARARSSSSSPSPSEKKEQARGTRLPADWQPSTELLAWAKSARVDLHLPTVIDAFRDHWKAVSGKGGVKLDWDATFRNWVRKERGGFGAPMQAAVKRIPCGYCTTDIGTGAWMQSPAGRACGRCSDVYRATGQWPEKVAA